MRKEWIIFFVIVIFTALFIKPYIATGNSASRLATVESLVEDRSFIIDNSVFLGNGSTYDLQNDLPILRRNSKLGINGTNDKIKVNSHFYSDKPAVFSLLMVPVYFVLHSVGLSMSNPLSIFILKLVFGSFIAGLIGVFLFKFFKIKNKKNKLLFPIGAIFLTLILPYATTINNHSIAGLFILMSLYYGLKKSKKYDFLSGLFISLAATIDLVAGGIFLLVMCFVRLFEDKKIPWIFFISIIPLFLLHAAITIPITGDILPGSMHSELWSYEGSQFSKENLSGLGIKHSSVIEFIVYGFNILIGARGLFSYSPILLLALFPLFKSTRKKDYLATIILASSTLIILFYWLTTNEYGGWSYGMRWFIPLMPLLALYAYDSFIVFYEKNKTLSTLLIIFSIIVSLVGLYEPWTDMWFSPVSFLNNLKEVVKWFI